MALLVGSVAVFTWLYFKRMLKAQQTLSDAAMEHQQALLNNSVIVQERERSRIAADLHDELINKLHTLALASRTSAPPEQQLPLILDSIEQVRGIAHDLSPPLLEDTDLGQLLQEQLHPMKWHYTVEWFVSDQHPLEVASPIKVQLLRMFQEVVNNIVKHADATAITVGLRISHTGIFLSMADNGKGFNTADQSSGLGLKNIEVRAQLLHAKYRFQSRSSGTRFKVLVPWPQSTTHEPN